MTEVAAEFSLPQDPDEQVRVELESFTYSDGTYIPCLSGGLLVVVGPNNSGKSLTLKDLVGHISTNAYVGRAVSQIELTKEATSEALTKWIVEHCVHWRNDQGQDMYGWAGMSATLDAYTHNWISFPNLANVSQVFVFYGSAETRLQAGNRTQNVDFAAQPPVHPMHLLYLDSDLESRLQQIVRRAFGLELFVDRFLGDKIALRVGAVPLMEQPSLTPTRTFIGELHERPVLEDQGDGVRSFTGLALNIIVASWPIVLVDEPEAFLHPPQARQLGQFLAAERSPLSQVFVATHSADVLQGILDASESVTIVRLQEEDNVHTATVLLAEKVKDLWRDPLLRYSRILDGLFHDGVVVCEADADCRFYESVLDVLVDECHAAGSDVRRPELLFTHTGGKQRLGVVVEALRSLRVPVRVVADFDVLKNEEILKPLTETLGGDWGSMRHNWSVLTSSIEEEAKPLRTNYLRQEVRRILDHASEPCPTAPELSELRDLLREESGWEKVKRGGIGAVAAGDSDKSLSKPAGPTLCARHLRGTCRRA